MEQKIDLVEAVRSVRTQLLSIDAETRRLHNIAGDNYKPIMEFSECEFEFNVAFEKDGKGGFDVKVLQLSGGAKKSESNKIIIKFVATEGIVAPGTSDDELDLPKESERGVRENK